MLRARPSALLLLAAIALPACGDDAETTAPPPPTPTAETVTLTMEPFTVGPGEEVYYCQDFKNPFDREIEVTRFDSAMTPGSHHLLLFYKDGAEDSAREPCSGLEFSATPYSTQLPKDALAFPAGVAARVPEGRGFRIQSHYLNTTGAELAASVEVTLTLAEDGTVTQHAGVLFVVQPQIYVPAHTTETVQGGCAIPYDMSLTKASSHMHRHGTHFVATIGDDVVFETEEWADPAPATWDPGLPVKGGDPLSFECTFVNEGSTPLGFGESADTDEMCIFAAAFYPVQGDAVTETCF